MVSMMMRNIVESALSGHEAQNRFTQRISKLAESQDVFLSENDMLALAQLGERYVRETIRLLESCVTAASQARADDLLKPVVSQCERFFLQSCPGVPDQRGLLGMMCNAYLSRELIARLSEQMRVARGFPLIAADPHPEAEIIRRIIGTELTGLLDQSVEDCTAQPQFRFLSNSAYSLQNSLRATGRTGDWGGSLHDEMAQYGKALGLSFA